MRASIYNTNCMYCTCVVPDGDNSGEQWKRVQSVLSVPSPVRLEAGEDQLLSF